MDALEAGCYYRLRGFNGYRDVDDVDDIIVLILNPTSAKKKNKDCKRSNYQYWYETIKIFKRVKYGGQVGCVYCYAEENGNPCWKTYTKMPEEEVLAWLL